MLKPISSPAFTGTKTIHITPVNLPEVELLKHCSYDGTNDTFEIPKKCKVKLPNDNLLKSILKGHKWEYYPITKSFARKIEDYSNTDIIDKIKGLTKLIPVYSWENPNGETVVKYYGNPSKDYVMLTVKKNATDNLSEVQITQEDHEPVGIVNFQELITSEMVKGSPQEKELKKVIAEICKK